jgi:hypothetical protein
MAMDPKPVPSTTAGMSAGPRRDKGIRIFSYPKVIFLYPTLIAALICWIGMLMIGDVTHDPLKPPPAAGASAPAVKAGSATAGAATTTTVPAKHDRFKAPQNLFAVLFLGVFAFNLLVMALDFPRFTIVGGILLALFAIFFILWIGAYFEVDLMIWVRSVMATIYAVANAEFYLMTALTLAVVFGIIFVTRYLDFWEILPNEILHHQPLSTLKRYPTTNLKFDNEIPDVLEYFMLGSGRVVLHIANEPKSIVLENVPFINTIESAMKTLVSRVEVRLPTDQEVADL